MDVLKEPAVPAPRPTAPPAAAWKAPVWQQPPPPKPLSDHEADPAMAWSASAPSAAAANPRHVATGTTAVSAAESSHFFQLLSRAGSAATAQEAKGATAVGKGSQLPVEEHRAAIVKAVREHSVVVIRGDTGSGKSSQVPQFLVDGDADAKVVVAQVSEPLAPRAGAKARGSVSPLLPGLGQRRVAVAAEGNPSFQDFLNIRYCPPLHSRLSSHQLPAGYVMPRRALD